MSIFDAWVAVTQLEPGIDYRVQYRVQCLNSVTNADMATALAEYDIVTVSAGLTGPISSIISGSKMDFRVRRQMSAAEFAGLMTSAFSRASASSLLECSTPDIDSVQRLKEGQGLGGSAFGGGAVFALLAVGIVAVLVWRAR